jgi:transcriptional regulator with XRE-family HTH domain
MNVGTQIRWVREAKGWSQAKLAAGADMGVSGISQIETGARNPSVATLSKIAEALEVDVAALFPKAQSRSSPEPKLFYGIKGERREYDFQAARDGLDRFCAYWEQRLADGRISRQEFEDVGATVEAWMPILATALAAEGNEIIASGRRNPHPELYGTGSEVLSLSEIMKAGDRYMRLGERLAQAEHEMYGDDMEAEKRRSSFKVLEGLRDTA